MNIKIILTLKQADTVRARFQNDADCADAPADSRYYIQISEKVSKAINAAIKADFQEKKL